nr:hypothetical protein GCM10020092_045540 [Actinoplanes digitatis]
MIRVMIADDQAMVRTGFGMIIGAQPDMELVGEAADGVEAVAMARKLRPDVALFDIRMPRMDGLEALRLLADPGVADPIKVVVVTTFDLDEYVHQALRNGAAGFLLKDSGPALLVEAVRAAMSGDALISPSITVRLLEHLSPPHAGGRRRRPVAARAGRGEAGGPRPDERGDRHQALHLGRHGQDAPGQRPDQAGRPQPGGDRRMGLGAPPGRLIGRSAQSPETSIQ